MNDKKEKLERILNVLYSVHGNSKQAFRELGLNESEVQLRSFVLPDVYKMLPEDIVTFHNYIRRASILALHQLGLSQREISRRIGGSSQRAVSDVLKEELKKAEEGRFNE